MADKLTKEERLKLSITRLKKSNGILRLENNALKEKLHQLEERIGELEEKLDCKEEQRRQLLERLYKPNTDGNESKPLGKKPGTRGYQRVKPTDADVTEERVYTPTKCPYCKRTDTLSPAQETVVKYHEDIVIVPEKIIRKHVITKHWCSNCKEYIRSDKVPANIERIGPNVMAYVLYARYCLRLPYNKIKQSLKDLHDFEISEGEIADELEKAKELFKSDYEAITELIQVSDKVYCDETGWRVKGKNFWIWVFVVPEEGIKYCIEDTRGKGVAQETLGEKEDRVLISDFYGAYKNIPGENQYCWVHLLRDSKLTESAFHEEIKSVYHELTAELHKEVEKREYERLDKLLQGIAGKIYSDKNSVRVKQLQERIQRHRKELLTCVRYKDIKPENNIAERALRNNVVMRKIFGGSRSLKGAKVMETNITVIDTLRERNPGKTFFEVVLPRIKELRGDEH